MTEITLDLDGLEAIIGMEREHVIIIPSREDDILLHYQMAYFSAYAMLYTGAQALGIVPDPEDIARQAGALIDAYWTRASEKYKMFDDMSSEEINDELGL